MPRHRGIATTGDSDTEISIPWAILATLKPITTTLLDALSGEAQRSRRLRRNHNLHPDLADPVQRLCNALEPGTYVRPHRHPGTDRWELFLVLRGAAAVLIFDDRGTVVERTELVERGAVQGVEIPPRTWHTIVSLRPGTILFEVKPGPYSPTTDKQFADWAPDERDRESAAEFAAWYRAARVGAKPPPVNRGPGEGMHDRSAST